MKACFPYIGITGLTLPTHAPSLLFKFPLNGLPNHRLMAGVLVSSKSLAGEEPSRPSRYPKLESVADIFREDAYALNLVHYNTRDETTLFSQLKKIYDTVGPKVHGIQLNVAWPSIAALEDHFDNYGGEKYLVLQVGARAMQQLGKDPKLIAERIGHYVGMIDYVLIDPSGGLGRPYVVEDARRILSEIHDQRYSVRVGIAGGFGPGKMDHLKPIAKEFHGISIDMEKNVRTPQPEDLLDLSAAQAAVIEAGKILR